MNILFLTHPYPNYVPDLLLHGLRKLMGSRVVDFPMKERLYRGYLGLGVCSEDQLCPNWFPADNGQIDRTDIWNKVASGFFRYVICDIRAFSLIEKNCTTPPAGLVIVDGEDRPVRIPVGPYVVCRRETDGADYSIPLPMALPEEILRWISSFDNIPKTYSVGFLGSVTQLCMDRKIIVEELARAYPDCLFATTAVATDDDPKPRGRMGRNDYYGNLQRCRIVLSLRGAGYDTFRFWENAACRSIHIAQRFPLYVPNDFRNGEHIFRFADIGELRTIIDGLLRNEAGMEHIIRNARRHLVDFHLTTRRAAYLLDRLKNIF